MNRNELLKTQKTGFIILRSDNEARIGGVYPYIFIKDYEYQFYKFILSTKKPTLEYVPKSNFHFFEIAKYEIIK